MRCDRHIQKRWLLVVLHFFFVSSLFGHQHNKIIYCYLKVNSNRIILEEIDIVKGTLRTRNFDVGGTLSYDIFNIAGEMVLSGTIRDPFRIPCDYLDPTDPGRMKSGEVVQDAPLVVVRIPFQSNQQSLSLYKTGNGKRKRVTLGTVSLSSVYKTKSKNQPKKSLLAGATIQLVQGDSVDNRVNYCIFSEGYTQSELDRGKFIEDLKMGIEYQFSKTPYKQYKGHFAVWAISVASSKSGVGGYFGSQWSGRLLWCPYNKLRKAYDLLKELKPNWDMGLVLVNTTKYGGAGSEIAVSSIDPRYCGPLINHETGHGYAGLGDEYDDPGATPSECPNTTQETNRNRIKWKEWIESSTPIPTPETSSYGKVVGLFEGAAYRPKDWYRPMLKCCMDWLDDPFCIVCTETIIARAYKNVSPMDDHIPKSLTINFNDISDKKLTIIPLQPTEKTVRTLWHVNGKPVESNGHTLDLTKVSLNQGNNKVIALVADTTERIRIPKNFSPCRDTLSWTISYGSNAIHGQFDPPNKIIRLNTYQDKHFLHITLLNKQKIDITVVDCKGRVLEQVYQGILAKNAKPFALLANHSTARGVYFVQITTPHITQVISFTKL